MRVWAGIFGMILTAAGLMFFISGIIHWYKGFLIKAMKQALREFKAESDGPAKEKRSDEQHI